VIKNRRLTTPALVMLICLNRMSSFDEQFSATALLGLKTNCPDRVVV